MPREPRIPAIDRKNKHLREIVEHLREEVRMRVGKDATFEEESRSAMGVIADAMWLFEQERLEARVSTSEYVTVGADRYRRMPQPSSAIYHGLWGGHRIEEPLYRQVGVHNGPTTKPLEWRVGIVSKCLLPDLAHAASHLTAHLTSREVEATLSTLGFRPPSRAVLERRISELADVIVRNEDEIEAAVRADELVPDEVASVSVGLDRMAVRMDEPLEGQARDEVLERRLDRRYERTPPEPHTTAWRMAWVGSVTWYDAEGEALRTVRYGRDASSDPKALAQRLVEDVLHVLDHRADAKVVCVQDAAPDLNVLPTLLRESLPEAVARYHIVDIQHLLGYLGDVVVACEPPGDPNSMLDWYRHELLSHDDAIDRIFRQLRYRAKRTPRNHTAARQALAKALRYIRCRRHLMRYAGLAAANLPVGSGATESSCAVFQLRVKRPGSHWSPLGLCGVLALRGLVTSERWDAAWLHFAASHLAEVAAL